MNKTKIIRRKNGNRNNSTKEQNPYFPPQSQYPTGV
jgi:hypothetical protein